MIDHNAPQLRTIIDFCIDATNYLQQHSDNIIAIHVNILLRYKFIFFFILIL